MNEYTASLLRKQRLLAEEILNCKHSFRTPVMEMATAVPKAPGAKVGQSEDKAVADFPQMLQVDGTPGALFPDVSNFRGKLAQSEDGAKQTAPMSLARRYEAARQSADRSDAVRMWAISRYFQRDARRFREE